jgi:hypothetical protein
MSYSSFAKALGYDPNYSTSISNVEEKSLVPAVTTITSQSNPLIPQSIRFNSNDGLLVHEPLPKAIRNLSSQSIESAANHFCCVSGQCLQNMRDFVPRARQILLNFNEQERDAYLVRLIASFPRDQHQHIEYQMFGEKVCRDAFLIMLGISKDKLEKAIKMLHNPEMNTVMRGASLRMFQTNDTFIFKITSWFNNLYSGQVFDRSLFSDQVKLPVYGDRRQIYEMYVADCKSLNEQSASYETFLHVWSTTCTSFVTHQV